MRSYIRTADKQREQDGTEEKESRRARTEELGHES